MKPTPVAPTASGVQLMAKQQEMSPKEFEAQLAGYLDKEKPVTVHKEISDTKETNEKGIRKAIIKEIISKKKPDEKLDEEPDEKAQEESMEEIRILDSPLLYTGSFNRRQAQQPANGKMSGQSQIEVQQLLDSNEPVFSAQITVESKKIEAFIQKEDLMPDVQKTQFTEMPMESADKAVNDLQKSLKQPLVSSEETVEIEKKLFFKPTVVNESANKIQVESFTKNGTSFLVKDADLIESDQVLVDLGENEFVGSILPTGRFLTAEWKNGRMVLNQSIAEAVDSTTLLSEPAASNGELELPSLETIESRSKTLTEPVLNETSLKKLFSSVKNLESSEAVAQVAEVDKEGQSIQQQLIFEASSVKQQSGLDAVKQTGIQMVSEVVMEETETVLSGKQSVAHVTLTPEKMGEVKITVELTDNVLLTKIVVDNVETRELLTTGMNRLTDNLDRQNIRLGELTIQLNENATSDFTSQERQREEQKSTFEQQQSNFSDNERETLKSEGKTDTDTGRLSILV